jgi:hypothetical protein
MFWAPQVTGTQGALTPWRRGGTSKRFSERLLNRISGLAGSSEEPVKGYEPQSSRTMYRPLRPASLESNQKNQVFPKHSPHDIRRALFDDEGS